MTDVLVSNATVVTSTHVFEGEIAIDDGRIAAIGPPGSLGRGRERFEEVLDARGLHVLPGVIDDHVHFREPGLTLKEDFASGTRSAVFGGVTTVLDMPNTLPPTSTAALLDAKRDLADGRIYCDVGLYGLLAQDNLDQLEPMAAAGAVGFKCFLGQSVGDIPPPDDDVLLAALTTAARLGMRVAFHAEDNALLQQASRRVRDEGRTDPLAHVEARPIEAEVVAIEHACRLARQAGAQIHILHLSSRPGLDVIEQWRQQGLDVTCEVTPHHCFLTADDMVRLGPLLRINPPVRPPGHAEKLLAALADGRIDCIGTDHSPHLWSEKDHADIWQAISGFAGVETSLRLFLTLGVDAGAMSLSRLVHATSEAPARAWKLFPRKGALQVGSDADLTIVDLDAAGVVDAGQLHGKNNHTPFQGQRTRGAAVGTIVRGNVVMWRGELREPPVGRVICRVA